MKFLFMLLGLIALSNCASDPTTGYSSKSLYPTEYHSISVPIFENTTMTRNMEFMLTDAVIKQIQSRTPYRVVNESYADTLLTGSITKVVLQPINQSRTTGLDNEVLLKVTINFEWLSLNTGTRIVGKKNFTSEALFVPSRPSSEPIEMGQFAVVQQLAADIVDQMQASW